jgi:predicted transport protein
MSALDKARATQLANIETKTGKSLDALRQALAASGKTKHGELRSWAMETFGLGHGDANSLVHMALQTDGQSAAEAAGASGDEVLNTIYSGKKAHLRPIHEALMAAISGFGDFEIAPKKGYVALRRKKQFAMLGPKTNDRFELGLNIKGDALNDRAKPVPPGGMCQYIVVLSDSSEVDSDVIALAKQAYDGAF